MAPARVLNAGRGQPGALGDFIPGREAARGITAHKRLLPMQPGDVTRTWADISALDALCGFRPRISLGEGLQDLARWAQAYPALLAESHTDTTIADPLRQADRAMLAFPVPERTELPAHELRDFPSQG
jgi:UDP-glucuronate 4-epimerase